MAKKRKASGRQSQPSGPKELDPSDARLGPITTYKDVADSEDEFFINRDNLMLEDEPGSKRRRKANDDIELSDEDVLDDADDSDDSDAVTLMQPPSKSKKAKSKAADSDDEEEEEEEEDGDEGWWGSSKRDYYDADNIETEGDALEEEAEAKRLQQKRLSKMTDADFIFDESEWAAAESDKGEDDQPVTEVLGDVEITDDMGPEERYRMLKARYPEFEPLAAEIEQQQSLLVTLKASAKSRGTKSLEAVKYWVLGCYVAALASYFAILASPARDGSRAEKPLDPSELRDHEIMETLVSCREAWQKIKDLRSAQASDGPDMEMPMALDDIEEEPLVNGQLQELKMKSKKKKTAKDKDAKKLAKLKSAEAAVADLYDLPLTTKKSKKQDKNPISAADEADEHFGEESVLDARTAADKAARKRTLGFYTSQIAQKSNRRAGAGRDAGGDMDIPHRERLRDRQARLLQEAERRSQKDSKRGAALDDNSDEEDASAANAIRNDEDEYYDMVAHQSKMKKDDKAARSAAHAAAGKRDRIVENEEIGEDGKRKITYAIEKNKGLTPRRKKDVRNPRVKKRNQYAAKQKKLASMKPIWKGGEPKGGYRGELSGINTGVIKSVKL